MTQPAIKLIRITTVPISLDKLLHGQLSFMSRHFEVIAVSSDNGALERIGKRENVRTFCVALTRQITPLQDLLCLWKLYCYFRLERPNIVHSHTPKAGTIGMIAALLAGVPNRLHTVAGLPLMEAKGFKRVLLNMVEKLTYASATKVYPNSKGLYDFIKEQTLVSANKMKVIANGSSNGIDTGWFNPSVQILNTNPRTELGISKDDFVFVFVGRILADKGINELISAFMQLYHEQKYIRLLLVGNYEDQSSPINHETRNHINNCPSIHAVGYQEDVRPYLLISDAMVFPSYREGFPNVVMQAGAMNLPVIATDINGCNEIISEGVNGILVPPKDAKALLTAMRHLCTDVVMRNQLAANSRAFIVNGFEQRVVWDAILEEYRTILRQSHHV
jgi:glycosyltransferase involved in cell wall biosynthesis